MVVNDFAIENLALEFDLGIDSALYQSSVKDIRCGLGFRPAGNAAAGLTIYNNDNPTAYGNVSLSINPEVPDTLLLMGKSQFEGVLVSDLFTTLNITTIGSVNSNFITSNTGIEVGEGNINVSAGNVYADNFFNNTAQMITATIPDILGNWTGTVTSLYNLSVTNNSWVSVSGSNSTHIAKIITFIFISNGDSYVITFDSNVFRSAGTLTLTLPALYTIQFIYDGTRWIELARSTGNILID